VVAVVQALAKAVVHHPDGVCAHGQAGSCGDGKQRRAPQRRDNPLQNKPQSDSEKKEKKNREAQP
jgi:hypothetical protein